MALFKLAAELQVKTAVHVVVRNIDGMENGHMGILIK